MANRGVDPSVYAKNQSKEWVELPPELKQLVVKELSVSERLKMRDVSLESQALVDTCPLRIRALTIKFEDWGVNWHTVPFEGRGALSRTLTSYDIGIVAWEGERGVRLPQYESFVDAAVDDLMRLFSNDQLKIELLRIIPTPGHNQRVTSYLSKRFLRKFNDVLSRSPHQLNVEFAGICGHRVTPEDVLNVLPHLKPGNLKRVTMVSSDPAHVHQLEPLVHLEQFKQLKRICSILPIAPVKAIFGLQSVDVAVQSLSKEVVTNILEATVKKTDFTEYRLYCDVPNPKEIAEALPRSTVEDFQLPKLGPNFYNINGPTYFKHFKMENIDEILEVKITSTQVLFRTMSFLQTQVPMDR